MRPEHAHGLAALDEQRLVLAEAQEAADKPPKRLMIARSLSRAAVDDELLRPLGDLAIQIVEQHAEWRLRLPGTRIQLRPAGRPDPAEVSTERLDRGLHHLHSGHGPPDSCRAARLASIHIRHHVQLVASTNAAPAPIAAFHAF